MNTVYWIYKVGHQNGPFTLSKIQNMWQAGTINAADRIRRADQQDWHVIGEISRHLGWTRAQLRFKIVGAVMITLLSAAFVGSFVIVRRMYS